MSKIQVLIIGAGQIAAGYDSPESDLVLTHAKAITRSEIMELAGFYDVNIEAARNAATKWDTRVVESVFNIDSIDVVCCAVPDKSHYNIMMTLSQLNHLKAIICEKPLADTYERACEIRDIYENNRVPVFVNYTRRYLQEFVDLRKWIIGQAGEFITGHCIYGKGIVHNGSHLINLLQYLLGELSIDLVSGLIYDYSSEDPSVEFIIKSGEAKIVFQAVPCDVVTIFELDLFFDKGRVKYDDAKGRIDYYTIMDSKEYPGYRNYYQYRTVNINRNQAIESLYSNVCDVVTGESSTVRGDMNSSVETLKICKEVKERIRG